MEEYLNGYRNQNRRCLGSAFGAPLSDSTVLAEGQTTTAEQGWVSGRHLMVPVDTRHLSGLCSSPVVTVRYGT